MGARRVFETRTVDLQNNLGDMIYPAHAPATTRRAERVRKDA